MSDSYHARTFKSGNSVALRLPKALGFREGDDVVVVPHAGGSFSMFRTTDAKRVFMSLYGAFSPGFMADGRDDSEHQERDWRKPPSEEAARR